MTPSPELERGAAAADTEFVHAVAGIHRVVHGVHPATEESREFHAAGVEV